MPHTVERSKSIVYHLVCIYSWDFSCQNCCFHTCLQMYHGLIGLSACTCWNLRTWESNKFWVIFCVLVCICLLNAQSIWHMTYLGCVWAWKVSLARHCGHAWKVSVVIYLFRRFVSKVSFVWIMFPAAINMILYHLSCVHCFACFIIGNMLKWREHWIIMFIIYHVYVVQSRKKWIMCMCYCSVDVFC